MTRTYALLRLLEHGPLTYSELLQITKWEREQLQQELIDLTSSKDIKATIENKRDTRYVLCKQ